MKINQTFDTGNFTLAISGEVKAEKEAKLISDGFRYALEREVATGVYKTLRGEGEKKSLPKGFKRDSIEFNAANAQAFQSAAVGALGSLLDGVTVTVGEYVPSVAEKKYATEKAYMSKWESAGVLESQLAKVGYSGDTHDEDGEFHIEACKALNSWLAARMAELLAPTKA